MRFAVAGLCAIAVVGACGSKKKKPFGVETGSASPSGSAQTATAPRAQPMANGGLQWNAPPAFTAPTKPVANHHFHAPVPEPSADPDGVIARYKSECPKGPTSDSCVKLKREVERILLETIIELRAGMVPIDPHWWRVAAAADLPQLACQGVFGLAREKNRAPEDDAAILAALDHPAPSVRSMVFATRLPAVEALSSRAASSPRSSIMCVDGLTDRRYDNSWAGGYPNAKFRFFASSPTKRWFTTPDSVEQVTAYFTKAGKPPATTEELQVQLRQRMAAEIQRITSTAKEDDVDKMNAEVQALAQKATPPKLQNVDGTGEVRYVELGTGSNIWIAIFKDEVLKATSIVALAPPPTIDMSPEGLQRARRASQVLDL